MTMIPITLSKSRELKWWSRMALSGFGMVLLLLTSCGEDEVDDLVPPGEVSGIEVEPLNGGARFTYKLPGDEDLHYVEAVYTNAQGIEVFKVASFYETTVEIDGFNDTLMHSATLHTVDRSRNRSEGVEVSFNPLVSHIHLVKESIWIEPALGGVQVHWQNEAARQVFVYLYIENGEQSEERILSSSSMDETFMVRGLDSILYDFSVVVEDFSGNKTEKVFKQTIKPLFEEKINKSDWSLVGSLSVDGNAWEGETVNFFDDVVDTKDSPADNSYFIINRDNNGGVLNFPLDIVIDMNKQVVVNRFTVWQRAYWYSDAENQGVSAEYYYYQNENMRSFDLWASNDLDEWLLLGKFDIGDPKDDDGNIPPDKIQEAIDGHEFTLDEISDPFRYLKFSITAGYGSETNVYGSEITLFGIDNVAAR
jgi:hypothetical protein